MRLPDMDRFTFAYADAALADSVDDDGTTLRHHGLGRLAPDTVRQMRADCATFRLEAGDLADAFELREVASDFWMERNARPYGGFLDGDYPGPGGQHPDPGRTPVPTLGSVPRRRVRAHPFVVRRAMGEVRIWIGEVGVESGQLMVIDPRHLDDWDHERSYEEVRRLSEGWGGQLESGEPGQGVAFPSGFGAGTYEVWATVRDLGERGRCVVRVDIDLLDEEDEP